MGEYLALVAAGKQAGSMPARLSVARRASRGSDGTARGEAALVQVAKEPKRRRDVLDGFGLLEASRAEHPDKAVKAKLCGKGLSSVVAEDMHFFTRLADLDVSENELGLADLVALPAVEELRLTFNGMKGIAPWPELPPFPFLRTLDLSFNKLKPDAVARLADLPRLRELDLTCNELRVVPDNMEDFRRLEVLLLGQNRLHEGSCLLSLSRAPRLVELDVSDNAFDHVPEGVQFDKLEWLSMVNNRVRQQADVEALLGAPELTQVLLYGNPITAASSAAARGGQQEPASAVAPPGESQYAASREAINVVTDAPMEGPIGHRHQAGRGRTMRGLYTDFRIARVEDLDVRKPGEWRAMGNEVLFGKLNEAESSAESKLHASTAAGLLEEQYDDDKEVEEEEEEEEDEEDEEEEDDFGGFEAKDEDEEEKRERASEAKYREHKEGAASIFMTEPSLFAEAGEAGDDLAGHESHRAAANNKQSSRPEESLQADTTAALDSTSTQALRERLARFSGDAAYAAETSMRRAKGRRPRPGQLRHAMSALRFALQHPLTAHESGTEGDENAGRTDELGQVRRFESFSRFETDTTSSKLKKKPKQQPYPGRGIGSSKRAAGPGKRRSVAAAAVAEARASKSKALDSIEMVLDRMEFNQDMSQHIADLMPSVKDETDRTVDGLIGLVNDVMDTFQA